MALAAAAPPQQLVREPLAQCLVEVVALERPVGQRIGDRVAHPVQRVGRRDAGRVERVDGRADQRAAAASSGGAEPTVNTATSSRGTATAAPRNVYTITS